MNNRFVAPRAWMNADGTAHANSTTEAILNGAGFPLPAETFRDGKILRLTAFGKYSATGTPTGTWTIRLTNAAGTLLATSEALTLAAVTNGNWSLEAYIVSRSLLSSSGSLLVMGHLFVHTAAGTVLVNVFGVSGWDAPANVGSIDFTAAQVLCLCFDWSAADAANTITCMIANLEDLN